MSVPKVAMKRVRFYLRPWVRTLKPGDRVCKPHASWHPLSGEYQGVIQEVNADGLRVLVFGFNNPRTLWHYHEIRPWWGSLIQPFIFASVAIIFAIYCLVQAFCRL
jgi:hypothetical protein